MCLTVHPLPASGSPTPKFWAVYRGVGPGRITQMNHFRGRSPSIARGRLTRENLPSRQSERPEGTYSVTLQTAEKAVFDRFRPPHTGQIHARSGVRTLFGKSQKMNSANFALTELSEVRLLGFLGSTRRKGQKIRHMAPAPICPLRLVPMFATVVA